MAQRRQTGTIWTPCGAQYDSDVFRARPGDRPPLVPSIYDDEFEDASIDPKWSWSNQGGATIAEADGRQTLTMPNNASGFNWRIRKQAIATTGDFTLSAKVCLAITPNFASSRAGIALIASGSGKMLTWYLLSSSSGVFTLAFERWNSSTSFNGLIGSQLSARSEVIYVRFQVVGTTITPFGSPDGVNWWSFGTTESIATFLGTGRSDLDTIAFLGTDDGVGVTAYASCEWLRVT